MAGEAEPLTPAASAGATEPLAPAAPVAIEPVAPAPAPAETPAAPAADAAPATREFASSLLDEAAKTPTADAKPGDAAPDKDAAKPADGTAPAPKEPAAQDGKPADQAKPDGDGKPAAPPAPIEYAFTMEKDGERVPIAPDQVDPERFGAFTGILNDARVPPEAGQKLVDLHLAEVKRVEQMISDRQWETFANTNREWRDRVMADPELGGSRHATAIRTVMGLIDAFSLRNDGKPRSADAVAAERKELLDVARVTGVANNPAWLRLLHWAGDRLVREGTPRLAPPPRTPAPTGTERGLRRYQGTTPAR